MATTRAHTAIENAEDEKVAKEKNTNTIDMKNEETSNVEMKEITVRA